MEQRVRVAMLDASFCRLEQTPFLALDNNIQKYALEHLRVPLDQPPEPLLASHTVGKAGLIPRLIQTLAHGDWHRRNGRKTERGESKFSPGRIVKGTRMDVIRFMLTSLLCNQRVIASARRRRCLRAQPVGLHVAFSLCFDEALSCDKSVALSLLLE